MPHFNVKRLGVATLVVAALTVCGRAASPDATPAAAPRSSASLFPELPDGGQESRLPGNRFDFLRRDSSVGGVVEGVPSPTVGEHPGARAVDLLDRRRNWIYSTQTSSSFEASAERALGVRSSERAASAGESEGWLSEFFHDRGSQRPQNRPFDDVLYRPLQVPGFNTSLLGSVASGLGLSGQNGPLGMAPYQNAGAEVSALGSPRSRLSDSVGLRQHELLGVPNSIRDLLASPGGANPLDAGFDPINLRVDSTRQELNPTSPDPLTDLRRSPRTADALLDRPVRTVGEGRPSALDAFNARMLGNSSLAPAVTPAPEIQPLNRPLDFGQFPARRF